MDVLIVYECFRISEFYFEDRKLFAVFEIYSTLYVLEVDYIYYETFLLFSLESHGDTSSNKMSYFHYVLNIVHV